MPLAKYSEDTRLKIYQKLKCPAYDIRSTISLEKLTLGLNHLQKISWKGLSDTCFSLTRIKRTYTGFKDFKFNTVKYMRT